jgi:uncharacterized protein (TIGR00369 family)
LPNYEGCFICGHANPRALDIRFFVEGEAVVARLQTDASHAGYPDRVHGGILAALLDETMGWAPSVRFGRFCVAVELNVRYLKPAPVGTVLVVRGEVAGEQRRLWEAVGEVRSEAGVLYARGRGKYFPLSEAETDRVMAILTVEGEHLPLAEAIRRAR